MTASSELRIAQLTDPHVVPAGKLLHDVTDSSGRLEQAIDFVNAMAPRVDVLLLTGDLVESGNRPSYERLRDILKAARVPVFLIPGNHDNKDLMAEMFGDTPSYPVAGGLAQYAVEDFPVRLVALDSVDVDSELAEFTAERARWLDRTLAAEPGKPTLLFIHHPPMRTGVAFVDLSDPQWTDGLAEVVARHPQVRYLVSGHAHMAVQGTLAGVPVYVAPSTAFQLVSRLGVDEAPAKVDVPGPIPLHYWNGKDFLTTTYSALETNDADRLDALSGMSWEDLKKFMAIKVA